MLELAKLDNIFLGKTIKALVRSRLGNLPEKGILAGQAVASAIFDVISDDLKGQYNDADVFFCDGRKLFTQQEFEFEEMDQQSLLKISSPKGILIDSGEYGVEAGQVSKSGYYIRAVGNWSLNRRVNLIGIGLFQYSQDRDNVKNVLELIIEGFDINAVQVAVDLTTNAVVWSPEFQNFLYQKRLQVATFYTPMHTSIRILNKANAIKGATLNRERELTRLAVVRSFMERTEMVKSEYSNYTVGNLFTRKTLAKYMAHKGILDRYFIVKDKTIELYDVKLNKWVRKDFFVLSPKHSYRLINKIWSMLGMKSCVSGHIDPLICILDDVVTILGSRREKDIKRSETLDFIMHTIDEKLGNIESRSYYLQWLRLKFLQIWHYNRTLRIENLSTTDIGRIIKQYIKHQNLFSRLGELRFERVNTLSKALSWLEKKRMQFLIGYTACNANKFDLIANNDRQGMSEYYEIICKELRDDSVEPVLLEKDICCHPDYSVREITNSLDLLRHGNYMRNCVGGYWNRIRHGSCVILDVKKRCGEHITMHLDVGTHKDNTTIYHFNLMEAKSRDNAPLGEIDMAFTLELVAHLNNKGIKSNKVKNIAKANHYLRSPEIPF